MTFDLMFDLQSQIQGQGTGYPISSRTYVVKRSKMIPNNGFPHWAAYITITFILVPDLRGQVQDQRTGTGYRPEIASAHVSKRPQVTASLH